MNIRMDEFSLVARTDYVISRLMSLYPNEINDSFIQEYEHDTAMSEELVEETLRRIRFIMEMIIPGLKMTTYLVTHTDKFIRCVFGMSFMLEENSGETSMSYFSLYISNKDVLLISPFDLSRNPSNELNYFDSFTIKLFTTEELLNLEGTPVSLAKFAEQKSDNIGVKLTTYAKTIKPVMESFMKPLREFGYSEFKTVAQGTKEYEQVDNDYMKAFKHDNDLINAIDFMPILIKDDDVKFAGRLYSKVYNARKEDSDAELYTARSNDDGEVKPIMDILVGVPEGAECEVIKLPPKAKYLSYNRIKYYYYNERYEFVKLISLDDVGYETEFCEASFLGFESVKDTGVKVLGAFNDSLLVPFKEFGIDKGSKMYEILRSVTRMPIKIAKGAFSMCFGVFKTTAKLEKEESEELKESMLNDELDVFLIKLDVLLKKVVMYGTLWVLFNNLIFALIAWLFTKGRVDKIKIKALERNERRVVSIIKQYNQKIAFATENSDYPAVKKYTQIRDTYKAMLDKLREVKSESFKKDEKFTDTFKEYDE